MNVRVAEVRDDRRGRLRHQADGSQRHQNRRDAERGRQDQAHRRQDLAGADGLEAGGCWSGAIAGRMSWS
jgi:hypothetical protein